MASKGGISSSNSLQLIIRKAALYVSILIGIYTAAFTSGIIKSSSPNENQFIGYTFAVIWILSGIIQYFSYRATPKNMLIRLSWYQFLAALYFIVITGISGFAFTSCWMIIAAVSYNYYGVRGYMISLAIFWIATVSHNMLFAQSVSDLASDIHVALSITITMSIILLFFRVQERDDDELKKSRRDEKLQRESLVTLVNNLTDAIISTDSEGKVTLYNAAAGNLLDTNVSLTHSSIDDILRLENESHEVISLKSLLLTSTKLTVNDQLRAVIGDETIRVELTYSPIRNSDGKSTDASYIVIMRDITKSKSLEEERDEFISVVSHELRTPIAITEGAIDNAIVIFDKDTTKKAIVKKTLSLAHEQVIFLARMVNDLSTLSRAERGVADDAEIIDVKQLAHTLHDEYSPQATQKGLKLNLHTAGQLGTVNVSRLYLQELLQNFITNAIKYTKEGAIDISIEEKKGMIHFSVKDTGIGISRTDLKRIFNKFYRSEDYRTRETGGTGLGLYVAEKLARKLECTINVKSRLNHGSEFSFTIPKFTK
jgi:PAS domain S-box-containing protein